LKFITKHADRFCAARLIRHRRNQGPAMARNTGIAWSDEPFLFLLDADNRIRRPALSRLFEAILSTEAEFAYSQVCFFGARGGLGLADIWSLERLRSDTYIDMMALIKREALLTAGGVIPLADDVGWEDHDLWCRFAELGFRGVFLPELLCEYRIHEAARTRATDSILDHLAAEIVLRHPTLFYRSMTSGVLEDQPNADENSNGPYGREAEDLSGDTDSPAATARWPQNATELPKRGTPVGEESVPSSLRQYRAWHELEPLLADFFDPVWYRSRYPDLDLDGINLFEHYVNYGAEEQRNPCADFDTSFYLNNYPAVAESYQPPIAHYLLNGRDEGRSPKIFHIHDFGLNTQYKSTYPSIKQKYVCVLLHLYAIDLFEELGVYIDNVDDTKDIVINLVETTWNLDLYQKISVRFPNAKVIISPDSGRDIGGFSRMLSIVDHQKYDLFVFMHSKKSVHLLEHQGRAWRRGLLDPILGSPAIARARIERMRANPSIGMTAARAWRDTSLFGNRAKYNELLDLAGISTEARDCEFVAGTMFLARYEVAKRLHGVLRRLSFEEGHDAGREAQIDGQHAHAVERLIGNIVKDEKLSFSWV
jgi:hypothetical protein